MLNELIGAVVQVLLFALVPLIFWFVTARSKESFCTWIGLEKPACKEPWKAVLLTAIVALLYIGAIAMCVRILPEGITTAGSMFAGQGISALPSLFFYAFLRTALSEELLFRGFILKRLQDIKGFAVGNTVQALLFDRAGMDGTWLFESFDRNSFFVRRLVKLLESCGFKDVHVFWLSYMQMGIYGFRRNTMYADYHIHTEFSDDSREPMENQVRRAIELGLDEICFTDHVDYGIKKDWDEGEIEWRGGDGVNYDESQMDPLANVDYPAYFDKIRLMRSKYGDRIRIKQGLEFGIQTITIPQYERLWERYREELDFVLLSIHQVDNKEFWNQAFQSGKSQKEYNEAYYKEILDVMRQFKNYSVLAHLDLIVRYDKNGVYPFREVRDLVAEILKTAIADGKGIELNTSSWHYGLADTQPSRDILRLYKDLGGRIITIGSDGHTTRWLGDHIREAQEILKEIGFTEICTFDRMRPVFH